MADRIRVAHVVLQLETGGMERLLVEFAKHVDRTRFDLRFVALAGKGRLAADIESCGWPVIALDTPPGVRPGAVYRLARLFRSEGIDIVHTHNTKPLLYAGPGARLAGVVGVIHTRHGQRRGATGVQNRLFRLAARCADRMVCVSEDAARMALAEGIDAARVCTIPNGIDLTRFAYTGPAADGPAVYVGRLSPEKDVATLLRAAAIVVGKCPAFRLRVAGSGGCERELKELAGALGLGEHIRFVGEVADVPGLLSSASVFVLPSLSEGLPVTVLEAMARGVPVVATNVGGTPEAVEDGRTGLLVPPGDAARMAEAILRIHRDSSLGRGMGLAGRGRVEGRSDVRVMVARYETLYRAVIRAPVGVAA